jgi:hypothetical protein
MPEAIPVLGGAEPHRAARQKTVKHALSNVLRLETYIQDAERDGDSELADLFRRAQNQSRKGGEQGKEQLRKRLAG